jgi:hypothetical protein
MNKFPMSRPYFISRRPRIVRLLLTQPILDIRYSQPSHSILLSLYDYLYIWRPDYYKVLSKLHDHAESHFRSNVRSYTYIHQMLRIEEYEGDDE